MKVASVMSKSVRSQPGSFVCGILQARTLKWVAMPSFRGSSQPWDQTHVSYVSCFGQWVLYHYVTWEANTSLNKCLYFMSTHNTKKE